MSFPATWIDLDSVVLSEISQAKKDSLYAKSKKNYPNEVIYKIDSQT